MKGREKPAGGKAATARQPACPPPLPQPAHDARRPSCSSHSTPHAPVQRTLQVDGAAAVGVDLARQQLDLRLGGVLAQGAHDGAEFGGGDAAVVVLRVAGCCQGVAARVSSLCDLLLCAPVRAAFAVVHARARMRRSKRGAPLLSCVPPTLARALAAALT